VTEVEWIKIKVDMFEDEKIRLIESLPEGDTLLVIWMKLLSHAGKTNDGGYIYLKEGTPYTPQMLSIIFNRPQPTVELALKTFTDFGMIEIREKGIYIVNWEKHQNIDGLERIRQQTKERVRKYRERKKQEQKLLPEPKDEGNGGCNVTCNATETHGNALDKERDIDKEKDIDKDNAPKKPKPKSQKENLCSIDDIKTFVESQLASNPLPVNQKLLVKYIDCLRLYRKTARISKNIILTEWEKWKKFNPDVVSYAMWTHIEKHDDKPEEYTLAIMRNTNEHVAKRELIKLKNKADQEGHEYATGSKEHTGDSGTGQKESVTGGKVGWLAKDRVLSRKAKV
jgi:predicted phage replisome organizer